MSFRAGSIESDINYNGFAEKPPREIVMRANEILRIIKWPTGVSQVPNRNERRAIVNFPRAANEKPPGEINGALRIAS